MEKRNSIGIPSFAAIIELLSSLRMIKRMRRWKSSAVDEEESNQLRQEKVLLGKRKTACSSTDPLSEANESVSA
ncbi:hypothetical protein GQ457_05G002630 [Hibiscus cannabinus]